MAVIEVPDIMVAKGGAWSSLRGGAVAKDGFKTFDAGCGVAEGGNWHVLDIYEIWTPEDFDNIRNVDSGTYCKLMQDIDMTAYIAENYPGTGFPSIPIIDGTLDGNNKVVNGISYIQTVSGHYGIINIVTGHVFNLGITNIDLTTLGGCSFINVNNGIIENCFVTGACRTTSAGSDGALFVSSNYGIIRNCYARGNTQLSIRSGGFCGTNRNHGTIQNCYCAATISYTYNINHDDIGGFVGVGSSVTNIPVEGCYYDSTVAQRTDTNNNSIPKTTVEMKQQATFMDWDFNNVWIMPDNDYPRLKWEE